MIDSNTETCTSSSCCAKIYPSLNNTANASATSAAFQDVNAFRLQKINNMQKEISVERNEHERMYKKFNKIDWASSIVQTMAECGGIAYGSIGIASMVSVVAAPVGFVLEGVAIGLGGMVMGMKYA